MATPVRATIRQVKPLLSVDRVEAQRRVLNLYRAWYRQVPYILLSYDIPKTGDDLREKIRHEFLKNKNVEDIRVIDMLVIKGQMNLKEVVMQWKTKSSLMYMFDSDVPQTKPQDFLSKFLAGRD